MISDGAEILKRLPRAMPKPTTHIIDWFHIAMKIQPMQQIAEHIARSRSDLLEKLPSIDRDIRAVKWRLWHGRVDRAICDLEQLLASLKAWQGNDEPPTARLQSLSSELACRQANGEEAADEVDPAWRSHAYAGPDGRTKR
ncbi:hypothetical protein ABIF74_011828 [Bradyrhizobium japonicum]